MAQFEFKGRARGGDMQSGVITAGSKDEASSLLLKRGVTVTAIKEKGKEISLPKIGGGVSQKQLALFTRQFSVMIDAGLPLVQCLEILGSQNDNKAFARIIAGVREGVEGGMTLADSMKQYPKPFNDLYSNMIAAGEAGGILDTILQRLANYIEKIVKLNAAVRGAMIYPVAIVLVAIIVVIVIMTKVIPTFADLFAGLGAKLPALTQFVIDMSHFIQKFWWLLFLVIPISAVMSFTSIYRTKKGRYNFDKLFLKLPIFGILLRKIAVARFCQTLGTLVASGVPILEGLDVTARTAGNAVVEEAIMKTRKSIEEGKTIAEPLKDTGIFPPMVVQMIGVGEATGALDAMLNKIAEFYEREVDEAVANLMALLEPVIIVFLGVVIGGIVIAMYMPLFALISQME
jgi:type IV pilus assembly protein PilC